MTAEPAATVDALIDAARAEGSTPEARRDNRIRFDRLRVEMINRVAFADFAAQPSPTTSPPRDGVDLRALGVRAALHEIDSALVSALEIDDEGTEEDAIGDAAIAVIRRLRALLATLGDPAAIADAKLRSEGGVAALGLRRTTGFCRSAT